MNKNSCLVLLFTTVYAVLRYTIFGPVPYEEIPTLIFNKSISFALIILLGLSFLEKKKSEKRYAYLRVVNMFVIIHVLLSLALFTKGYFPKLFENEKLTLFGNLSLLAGVLATVFMMFRKFNIKNIYIYLLIEFHLLFIGIKGWFDYHKWFGMMPPITLICFLILLIPILLEGAKVKNDYFKIESDEKES